MMLKKKQFILLALCFILLFTNKEVIEGKSKFDGLDKITYDKNGDSVYSTIEFGTWRGKPVQWRILNVNKKTGKALLLANEVLEVRPYHNKREVVTWETSNARTWLNTTFYEKAFTKVEKQAIAISTVKTKESIFYTTSGGKTTKDKVFLPSIQEVTNASYGFLGCRMYDDTPVLDFYDKLEDSMFYPWDKARERAGSQDKKQKQWYLRTPGKDNVTSFIVKEGGWTDEVSSYQKKTKGIGYCPAIRVNLNQNKLYQKVKKAEKQKQEMTKIKEVWLSQDTIHLQKGKSFHLGTGSNMDIQIGMIPNTTKNRVVTVKQVGTPSDCIRMKKINNSTYEIQAKKQGETTLWVIPKEKKKHTLLLRITVREKNKIQKSDFQDVKYDESGNPIYSKVELGMWRGKPLEWRVLDVDEETGTAFLLSEHLIKRDMMVGEDSSNIWGECGVRRWLNKNGMTSFDNLMWRDYKKEYKSAIMERDYYNCGFYDEAFTNEEKQVIEETEIETNAWSEKYRKTKDKIFLLSSEDIANKKYGFTSEKVKGEQVKNAVGKPIEGKFNYYYKADKAKIATNLDGEIHSWWLRSFSDLTDMPNIIYVDKTGKVPLEGSGIVYDYYIRPAMNVNIGKCLQLAK